MFTHLLAFFFFDGMGVEDVSVAPTTVSLAGVFQVDEALTGRFQINEALAGVFQVNEDFEGRW